VETHSPAAASSPPASYAPVPRTKDDETPRVLLVDDEKRLLGVLRMALASYDVTTASSVDEALERIAEGDYDVVVSDVMMPGRSGVDLFAEVEQLRPELRDCFVFMTGGLQGRGTREQIASTQRPCIEKPFRGEELIEAIEAVLRDAQQRPVPAHSMLVKGETSPRSRDGRFRAGT
jgi:DNA-binding NtrC family response regulator